MTVFKNWSERADEIGGGDCFQTSEGVVVRILSRWDTEGVSWLAHQWTGSGWTVHKVRVKADDLEVRCINPEDW